MSLYPPVLHSISPSQTRPDLPSPLRLLPPPVRSRQLHQRQGRSHQPYRSWTYVETSLLHLRFFSLSFRRFFQVLLLVVPLTIFTAPSSLSSLFPSFPSSLTDSCRSSARFHRCIFSEPWLESETKERNERKRERDGIASPFICDPASQRAEISSILAPFVRRHLSLTFLQLRSMLRSDASRS